VRAFTFPTILWFIFIFFTHFLPILHRNYNVFWILIYYHFPTNLNLSYNICNAWELRFSRLWELCSVFWCRVHSSVDPVVSEKQTISTLSPHCM
jgi:hypothetical protein